MAHGPAATPKTLRRFGLLVGAIFALIGLRPLIGLSHGVPRLVPDASPRLWALIPGGALLVLGAVFPAALRLPYSGWMAVGGLLGWVNTRIILGLVFFLMVTPMGILKRWLGKDGMTRKLDPRADSYRVVRPPGQTSNLSDQF